MEGTGEGRGFFCSSKLPYLSTMSQQILSLIVDLDLQLTDLKNTYPARKLSI